MRDHVLLQALARVNRPFIDDDDVRKRVGLVHHRVNCSDV
jgi:type I restriction enzyme R subunit